MAENKKSFVLYTDLIHTVKKMPNDKAGELFKHILSYVNDENPETKDLIIELTFEPIKQQLKRDLKKFEEKKQERSNSGILGNLKRWNNDLYKMVISDKITIDEAQSIAKGRIANKSIANIAVNDNVNVNDILKRKGIKEKVAFEKCTPTNNQLEDFKEFLGYWFEHGENDKKMRFEKQKSFDWSRRWATWLKNKEKWNKEKSSAKKESGLLIDKMKHQYGINS